MGGRFWIGVVLLIVLLSAGLVLSSTLTENQQQVQALVDEAKSLAHQGDMAAAEQTAQNAYALWQSRCHLLAAIADHEPLDAAEADFQSLLAFAKEMDAEEFSAGCARLAAGIEAIAQAHELTWWNIL